MSTLSTSDTDAPAGTNVHDTHDPEHPAFLAHHFESPKQQFEAGKLGMWLFLATEILLFGGLFCVYAVFRRNHPDLFAYGSQFLDTKWGAINTVVLIVSSITMATAVTAAQMGRQRLLVGLLSLTFLGGAGFMCIKYVEYRHKFHENYVWGVGLYEAPHHEVEDTHAGPVAATAGPVGDVERGRVSFQETCRACHGVAGEGIPGQGKDQRGSEFIAGLDDAGLVAFIKKGRMPFDPLSTTGIQMPPKGGNPMLQDPELYDIVAYMRTFEPDPADAGDGEDAAADTAPAAFWVPRSSIPIAPPGPPGLAATLPVDETAQKAGLPDPRTDPNRPANLHVFFGIYFCMTGLHGIHVLAGMGMIGWLLVRSLRGEFGRAYFTPIDLGGLYWHVVDLIWIFLFPLFYLIA